MKNRYPIHHRRKVPKIKPQVKVSVRIVPGKATPAQCQQYKKLWRKLLAEVTNAK